MDEDRSTTEGEEPFRERDCREVLHHGGSRNRSTEGKRRKALHNEGSRAGSRKGTAAKRSIAEGVELVRRREPPRSAPPRRALNRSPKGDRAKCSTTDGIEPVVGSTTKRSTTEGVEPVTERETPQSAPRLRESSRSRKEIAA